MLQQLLKQKLLTRADASVHGERQLDKLLIHVCAQFELLQIMTALRVRDTISELRTDAIFVFVDRRNMKSKCLW